MEAQQRLLFSQTEKFALIRGARFDLSLPRIRRLKQLLEKIEAHASRGSGYTWRFLAAAMTVSVDTVRRSIRDGESVGVLVVRRQTGDVNAYQIQWERLGELCRSPVTPHPRQTARGSKLLGGVQQTAVGVQQTAVGSRNISPRAQSHQSPLEVPNSPNTPNGVCSEPPQAAYSEPADRQRSSPSEFVFPTTGKGSRDWTLSQEKLAEYVAAYPSLDVSAELRKARQWCRDNPRNRKTSGGMLAFLTRWLNRAQDRAGPVAAAQPRYAVKDYTNRVPFE